MTSRNPPSGGTRWRLTTEPPSDTWDAAFAPSPLDDKELRRGVSEQMFRHWVSRWETQEEGILWVIYDSHDTHRIAGRFKTETEAREACRDLNALAVLRYLSAASESMTEKKR